MGGLVDSLLRAQNKRFGQEFTEAIMAVFKVKGHVCRRRMVFIIRLKRGSTIAR
jgi:hypothetical protein